MEAVDRLLISDDPNALWAPVVRFNAKLCDIDPGIVPAGAYPEWFLVQDGTMMKAGDVVLIFVVGSETPIRVRIAEDNDLADRTRIAHVIAWGADLAEPRTKHLSECNIVTVN